jgi:hypothetical protein
MKNSFKKTKIKELNNYIILKKNLQIGLKKLYRYFIKYSKYSKIFKILYFAEKNTRQV